MPTKKAAKEAPRQPEGARERPLSESLEEIAERLSKIDNVAKGAFEISTSLDKLERSLTLRTLAEFGTPEARAWALDLLRKPFEDQGYFR
jgi:hypothetical protein